MCLYSQVLTEGSQASNARNFVNSPVFLKNLFGGFKISKCVHLYFCDIHVRKCRLKLVNISHDFRRFFLEINYQIVPSLLETNATLTICINYGFIVDEKLE